MGFECEELDVLRHRSGFSGFCQIYCIRFALPVHRRDLGVECKSDSHMLATQSLQTVNTIRVLGGPSPHFLAQN